MFSATTAAQNPGGSFKPPLSGSQVGPAAPPASDSSNAAPAAATETFIIRFMLIA